MPYVRMSYLGWSEDWLDNGEPNVDELFIKCFVNRYFAYPEDWDEDDVPSIMIWVRCITCGFVHEHFMKETEEEWRSFIYNRDNTYTSLSEPECDICSNPDTYNPTCQQERFKLVEEEYQNLLIYNAAEIIFRLGSEIEEYFWKAWRIAFPNFSLIPQYQIGNYYVDFAHVPTKTVIELDGKSFHTSQQQRAYDQVGQKKIEQQGWHFIRFQGGDIHYHVDRCIIETILLLSQVHKDLLIEAHFQWRSSPSARLMTRLQKQYKDDFIGDAP